MAAKKNFQMAVSITRTETSVHHHFPEIVYWEAGDKKTFKSSFATLEAAIETAKDFAANGIPADPSATIDRIVIINKETKEVVWKYEA